MKFEELTHKIIGRAMTFHHELGTGFPERIYQRALALELESVWIKFLEEHSMDICYKGTRIGRRRVDFLVEDTIMLEIKAVDELNDTCLVQTKNYLEIHGIKIGLLINFGGLSLQFKRIYNNKLYT
ncbi:MAG: GxxExxY protein [Patescibacteria group bacterium]|nr:GxxExxY protein [Patescibacteria group bacterium]